MTPYSSALKIAINHIHCAESQEATPHVQPYGEELVYVVKWDRCEAFFSLWVRKSYSPFCVI